MKVTLLATGETLELNESYAGRLIEQGKAALTPPGNSEFGIRNSELPNDQASQKEGPGERSLDSPDGLAQDDRAGAARRRAARKKKAGESAEGGA